MCPKMSTDFAAPSQTNWEILGLERMPDPLLKLDVTPKGTSLGETSSSKAWRVKIGRHVRPVQEKIKSCKLTVLGDKIS